MNYKKIYKDFIEKYRNQDIQDGVYTERHHIIPKSAGGSDSPENIIVLTYRQHVFAHRVLWKAYGRVQDLIAYNLMSGKESDARLATQRANGLKNVLSGHLDRIRPLANTPERQRKLRELNKSKWKSDEGMKAVRAANEAWRGSNHTEEFKANRSKLYKDRFSKGVFKEVGLELAKTGREVRYKNSLNHSEDVLSSDDVDVKYLYCKSNRSKHSFVAPNGLSFDSPIYASKYFKGRVKAHTVENWCKRGQHGWKRIPKSE